MRDSTCRLVFGGYCLFIAGCHTTATVHDDNKSKEVQADFRISEAQVILVIWSANEQIVSSALYSDQEINLERLSRAIKFFEASTGIESNSETYFGQFPIPPLEEALESWQRWFKENRQQLQMDSTSCRITMP